MNASTQERDDDRDLRYAEYVLGVLDAEERAAVAREIDTNPAAAAAVARWEQRLLPLAELAPEVPPAADLWARIAAATQSSAAGRGRRPDARSSVSLWRSIALGASAVAAALLAFVLLRPTRTLPTPSYLASTIQMADGAVLWTATLDRPHRRLIVVPGTPAPLPPARAPELWVIPAGAKPVALGMIAPGQPVTLALQVASMAQLGPTAKLAVSVEPPGGSPTGQPTGAVIAVGSIREVPAS